MADAKIQETISPVVEARTPKKLRHVNIDAEGTRYAEFQLYGSKEGLTLKELNGIEKADVQAVLNKIKCAHLLDLIDAAGVSCSYNTVKRENKRCYGYGCMPY